MLRRICVFGYSEEKISTFVKEILKFSSGQAMLMDVAQNGLIFYFESNCENDEMVIRLGDKISDYCEYLLVDPYTEFSSALIPDEAKRFQFQRQEDGSYLKTDLGGDALETIDFGERDMVTDDDDDSDGFAWFHDDSGNFGLNMAYEGDCAVTQDMVDSILDKITEKGRESLTKDELEILNNYNA